MPTTISPIKDLAIRDIEMALAVPDKRAAIAWYAHAFGLRFDPYGRASVAGRELILWGFPDAVAPSHVLVHVVTADLARAHQTLATAGVEVGAINEQTAAFEFADPWSNRWRFWQPAEWKAS